MIQKNNIGFKSFIKQTKFTFNEQEVKEFAYIIENTKWTSYLKHLMKIDAKNKKEYKKFLKHNEVVTEVDFNGKKIQIKYSKKQIEEIQKFLKQKEK